MSTNTQKQQPPPPTTTTTTQQEQGDNDKHDETTTKKYYHCYLLKSLDPHHPYKTYIGYTVNPARRIRQHNGILKNGGARRTRISGRPWTFVCIIHGFRDETSALKFEWAWQHPCRSTIFRSGLPYGGGGGAALGKVLEKRRGVKAKLHLAQILVCESLAYKEEELTLYFFEERCKVMFQSLFEPVGGVLEEDEEEEDPWCVALPSGMSCRTIERMEEMPFHIDAEQTRKERSKIRSKSKRGAKHRTNDDSDDTNSNIEEDEINNNKDCSTSDADTSSNDDNSDDDDDGVLGDLSSFSIHNAVGEEEASSTMRNDAKSIDPNDEDIIDMTDVYSIASTTTYNEEDEVSCSDDDTVDLLSPSNLEKPRKVPLPLEGGDGDDDSDSSEGWNLKRRLQQRKDDGRFGIPRIDLSSSLLEDTASESLSPSPRTCNRNWSDDDDTDGDNDKEGRSSPPIRMRTYPERRRRVISLGDNDDDDDDDDNDDDTIELAVDLDDNHTIDLCSP